MRSRLSVSPSARNRVVRAGFTLAELLVAAVLTAVIIGAALPFVTGQPKVIAAAAARGDAGQNARFALTTLDRELRMVGTGTTSAQPMLIAADPYAISFNADLVTSNPADIWGVSYDPSVDTAATVALQPPAITLPQTLGSYPQTSFLARSGTVAGAETISYWVSPDSSSMRANEYVLFRRVNRLPPVVVTAGIYLAPGAPFFKYVWADPAGVIDTVPTAALPFRHVAATHGSAADTGETANLASQVDRIRTVVVNAAGQYRDPRRGGALGQRTARASTTLINVTALRRNMCGTAPDPTVVTSVVPTPMSGPPSYVTLTWTAITDDGAGEHDVDRYLIYRAINGAPFTNPIADVPAVGRVGQSYTYVDYDVLRPPVPPQDSTSTNRFSYAVVAQDCQPQVGVAVPTTPVQLPVVP